MPELPEVTTIAGVLRNILVGKTIEKVSVYREKNIFSGAKEFADNLVGKHFEDVRRQGKFILMHLSGRKTLICHLRMEGKFYTREPGEMDRFDLVHFALSDGSILAYNDVRKFGGFWLTDTNNLMNSYPLNSLGKEPYDLTVDELVDLFKKDNRPIKEALLDQGKIAGIGNIYDSEILFASKIHPLRPARSLSRDEWAKVLSESKRILDEAIAFGGSTIRSYHPGKGIDGNMQNHLEMYGNEHKNCPICGYPIRRIFIGGRSSFFCPRCQKQENVPLIVGVTGPIASGKSTVSEYLTGIGYVHVDADAIVADLYTQKDVLSWVRKNIGRKAVKDGQIDRPALSAIVAKSPVKKAALEQHIHALVFNEFEKHIKANPNGKILLDVPLLIGSKYEDRCDLIIYIEADEKIRRARIAERGKDPELALAINRNYPKKKAKSVAAIRLSGNGSKEDLIRQLKEISYL